MASKAYTATFVLGLLLSFSAAVLGSAFAPSNRNSLVRVRGGVSSPTPLTNLHESTDQIDEDQPGKETSKAHETLRGGKGSLLPASLPKDPTLADFRKFALPCLALWVSGPLLSLVDTSFVGLSGSPSESAKMLAALGPATTFFDGATYLFAFLNVATTNLYSSARARSGEQSDEAEGVVRTAARVARNCGIGLMLFLFAACRPLLKLYIGHEVIENPYLLDQATDYVQIRALSMPTSLLLGVLQAALLGAKDAVTPLIAILYSTAINLVGDFVLVNRLKMGLRGAAIATLVAQWAATAALVGPARKRLVRDHNLGIIKKVQSVVTGRSFMAFAAPVLTLILGKLAAFGFMTHSAAAVPGQPLPLATHQIVLSLFFFVSPFLEVISQTAQTFLPPYFAPVKDYVTSMLADDPTYDAQKDEAIKPWATESMKAASKLVRLGLVVATVVSSIASLIPAFAGNLITSDPQVQVAVKPLAKYLLAGSFLAAPVAVAEGILLAKRELKFLASVYLASTALLPSALIRVKNIGGNVEQVWGCFAAFQLFRAILFMGRIYLGPLLAKLFHRRKAIEAKAS